MLNQENTDNDWIYLGEENPFFAVLTDEKFLLKNINNKALDDFWETGIHYVDGLKDRIEKYFHKYHINSSLDFGCGVGRLAKAMRQYIPHVIGVDISPGMLKIAPKNLPNDVELLRYIPHKKFDWVNSYIVFQHINPDQGYLRFNELLDCVEPHGVFSIHVTVFRDNNHKSQTKFKKKFRNIKKKISLFIKKQKGRKKYWIILICTTMMYLFY